MKIIMPFIIALVYTKLMGQSVGIGTATPASGAILEVRSNAKGVLIPRLSFDEMIAINNPAAGLLIYNTTQQQFYYYNGSVWQGLKLNLPGDFTVNLDGIVMQIQNTNAASSQPTVSIINAGGGGIIGNTNGDNTAVYGSNNSNGKGVSGLNTDAGHGVHARGANGQAVVAEIAPGGTGVAAKFKQLDPNGKALVVEGNLSLAFGSMNPGTGRILTSDAAGFATWQSAPYTAPRHGVEARGIAGNGANVQNRGVWFKFHFAIENYDPNGDYRLYNQVPSSTFVVSRAGTYEISSMINFPEADYDDCRVRVVLERGGIKTILAAKETTFEPGEYQHLRQTINLSTTAKLNVTDLVYIEVYQYNSNGNLTFPLFESEKKHYFTMALIDDL